MIQQTQEIKNTDYLGFNKFSHIQYKNKYNIEQEKNFTSTTLQSTAWLDLSHEPIVYTVPNTNDRYYTTNLQDMYNNATNIGKRTYGTKAKTFLLIPPNWEGIPPKGMIPFHVSTNYMYITLEIYIKPKDNFDKIYNLQNQFQFIPLSAYKNKHNVRHHILTHAPSSLYQKHPLKFYECLSHVIQNCGTLNGDEGLVASFQRLGIHRERAFNPLLLDDATKKGMTRAFHDGIKIIEDCKYKISKVQNGWYLAHLSQYGHNYLHRAAVNVLGSGVNIKEENIVFSACVDFNNKPLSSNKSYIIHFAPGATPPVDAFWSISIIQIPNQKTADQTHNQYTISNNSNLVKNKDGSLDIYIQNQSPGIIKENNWLPAPTGLFYLSLRACQPQEMMLSGNWDPPHIHQVKDKRTANQPKKDISHPDFSIPQ